MASTACLAWVIRSAPPFSWGEVESPSVAFDYVLLLGLLLPASDLAYVEAQFTLLGPRWMHHLPWWQASTSSPPTDGIRGSS